VTARRAFDLNGPPVVRAGKVTRPVTLAVDEIVVRDSSGRVIRRAFWGRGDFEAKPWAEVPA